MGANRRNKFFVSRRFSVHYASTGDGTYFILLEQYQRTKVNCQNGKAGHLAHMRSISDLADYHYNNIQQCDHHVDLHWRNYNFGG